MRFSIDILKKSAEIHRNTQKHPIKYPYQIPQAKTPSKNPLWGEESVGKWCQDV